MSNYTEYGAPNSPCASSISQGYDAKEIIFRGLNSDSPLQFGSFACAFVRESKMFIAGGKGIRSPDLRIMQLRVNNHKLQLSPVGKLPHQFVSGTCFHDPGDIDRSYFCFDYKYHTACTYRYYVHSYVCNDSKCTNLAPTWLIFTEQLTIMKYHIIWAELSCLTIC